MEDEEYKKLPIEDRCVHKLWKARVNGYEEVTKLFRQIDDEKSPEFGKYLGLVKKFVVDSNAMGQEKGLEATLAYVENYMHAGKTVSEVMSGVVGKCIAAPKTRTRELALQLTLMYIEIEKQEAVMEELIKGMEQKNPKIVSACIAASTLALHEFGSKIIGVKPLVKKISPLFADRDKNVRDEARHMVVEIYKWIGGALRSQLTNIQPVQLAELETEFAKIEGKKAVPIRYVRSQQKQVIAVVESGDNVDGETGECEEDDEPQAIDPYDLATPVEILSKLPKDFYDKLEEKKWQERKTVLEALETLSKTPKLENGDYGDVVRALKKIVQKDSNVVVVVIAVRCMTNLALGLKKRFQTYSGACIPALLEKFKEKKQNVVQAIREASDAVYATTNIDNILEDVLEFLSNKNPSVKSETSLFMARAFTKTSPSILNKKLLKILTTALLKNINDSDPTVRESTAEAVGTLMKLVGEKAISPFLVELEKDNLKMAKIKEWCDKAVIQVKTEQKKRPITAPSKTSSDDTAPTKTKAGVNPPRSAPPSGSRTITKKKASEISSGTATIVKSKSKTNVPKKTPKMVEKELGDDEVDELVSNILNSNITTEMTSAIWKARLIAVEQMLAELKTKETKTLPTQALVKLLVRKPGLKDTNFQVLKVKLDVVKYLAMNCTFSTTTGDACISDIAEKFGDPKNGATVAETVTAIAEATGLGYISNFLIDFAFNQKNPKVTQEILIWLSNAIKEFGFNNINTKILIDNIKKALASSNPVVRQSAITLCGTLYLYMGNTLHMIFENEKPALRAQINAELDKYEGAKPPPPTRGVVKSAASSNSLDEVENDDGEPEQEFNVQDKLPRVDISNQITENLINELEDKNWKVRNEALTKLNAIISEAEFIKPNIGDLPQALVHRLSDSNTKIAQLTLNTCEAIAKAMGSASKQYIRVFFPNFLHNLGDSKAWMRTTALQTINAFVEQCGYKEFFESEMVGDALKSGSPTLRIELWTWLAESLPKIPYKTIPKEELMICVPHLYSNLEDRNADVRKNAQEAVLGIMIHLGYETMVKQTEKLKPGSKSVVMAILEKVRPNLPAKPAPPKRQQSEPEKKVVKGTKTIANAKNVVKPKSAPSSKPTPQTTARGKKDEDIDTSPLLVANNMKHQRSIDEAKLKVLKWNFVTPREEFVDLLRDQMTAANVNRTLINNMFNIDFKYHIKAIESLMEDLPNNSQALVCNLDLILKWFTLRFFDTNPSVLIRGLEYLHSICKHLIDIKYRMLENEASSFIPYLIQKIGDPKDSVRNGVRSLLEQIVYIYPIGREFTYVMEGAKSKNARQRAECLELLRILLRDYGMTICTPSTSACLKEIAKNISDRDNSVRSAALNCVVQVYNIVGEEVYKLVGNISDKDLSLLEERIKRSSKKPQPVAKIVKPEDNTIINPNSKEKLPPSNNTSSGSNQSEYSERDECQEDEDNLPPMANLPPQIVEEPKEIVGRYSLDETFIRKLDDARTNFPHYKIMEFDLDFLREEIRVPTLSESRAKIMPLSPPKPVEQSSNRRSGANLVMQNQSKQPQPFIESAINLMTSRDPLIAIRAAGQIQEILSVKGDTFIGYEEDFFKAIISQFKILQNQSAMMSTIVCRLYKYILTTMDAFYKNNNFNILKNKPVMKELMYELIKLLVEDKLLNVPNGDAYVRIINLHCVKVIERSDHTEIICALVELMQDCIRTDASTRHTELVMKSLWRVIKLMPAWGDEINFEAILLQVHLFFKEFPFIWWKNRTVDTPVRTMKTILHSCVKIKGSTILTSLNKVPNLNESEVELYIMRVLKSMKIEDIKHIPTKSEIQKQSLSRTAHNLLTDIFQKIGTKDETKEGLILLYDFIQHHPEDDIEPFLKKSSKFFQDYIRNGLKEIEDSRKEVNGE